MKRIIKHIRKISDEVRKSRTDGGRYKQPQPYGRDQTKTVENNIRPREFIFPHGLPFAFPF